MHVAVLCKFGAQATLSQFLLLHSACFGQCAERDDLAGGPYPSTVVSLYVKVVCGVGQEILDHIVAGLCEAGVGGLFWRERVVRCGGLLVHKPGPRGAIAIARVGVIIPPKHHTRGSLRCAIQQMRLSRQQWGAFGMFRSPFPIAATAALAGAQSIASLEPEVHVTSDRTDAASAGALGAVHLPVGGFVYCLVHASMPGHDADATILLPASTRWISLRGANIVRDWN